MRASHPLLPSSLTMLLLLHFLLQSAVGEMPGQQQSSRWMAARNNVPKELMNPVVRSQIRQRLRQLKLKNEAAMRRKQAAADDSQPEFAAGSQILPTNRNCFFSPINCQLPVPLIGLRQRSIKRRIMPSPFLRQMPGEAEERPMIGRQYIMAIGQQKDDDVRRWRKRRR